MDMRVNYKDGDEVTRVLTLKAGAVTVWITVSDADENKRHTEYRLYFSSRYNSDQTH